MNTRTIIKLQWVVRIISLAIAISMLVLVFSRYEALIGQAQYSIFLWGTSWDHLLISIFLLLAVILAFRWPLIGGALMVITTAAVFIRSIVQWLGSVRPGSGTMTEAERRALLEQFGFSIRLDFKLSPIGWLGIALFICGLIFIYIAIRKRKAGAQWVERTVRKSDLLVISGWLSEGWKPLIAVAYIWVITLFVYTLVSITGSVNFPDNDLKAVINRYYLGADAHAQIQETDIAGIAAFNTFDYTINNLTGLEYCTFMETIDISDNNVADISPLANLTFLSTIDLSGNQISDIQPLVDNTGIGSGDVIHLEDNPLSSESIDVYIPTLLERGVEVHW